MIRFINRLDNGSKMKAIVTSDVSQWLPGYNATYKFLHQINASSSTVSNNSQFYLYIAENLGV